MKRIILISLFFGCNKSKFDYQKDYLSQYIGIMKYIPHGSFQRDSNKKNISIIKNGFHIMEKEVTYPQFYAITGISIEGNYISELPVKFVNWYHAIIFCNELSFSEGLEPVYSIGGITDTGQWIAMIGGKIPVSFCNEILDSVVVNWQADGYRLPSEMEWIWAAMGARDGKNGYKKRFAGDNKNQKSDINAYVWHKENSDSSSHLVGSKLPNELGIYDMSGNVSEWCWDWYSPYLPEGKINSGTKAGEGAFSGNARVQKGGSWRDTAALEGSFESLHHLSSRYGSLSYDRDFYVGFRVVRNE